MSNGERSLPSYINVCVPGPPMHSFPIPETHVKGTASFGNTVIQHMMATHLNNQSSNIWCQFHLHTYRLFASRPSASQVKVRYAVSYNGKRLPSAAQPLYLCSQERLLQVSLHSFDLLRVTSHEAFDHLFTNAGLCIEKSASVWAAILQLT